MYGLILFVLVFVQSGLSKFAPDYITPCPGQKSECLKKVAQAAIPKLVEGVSWLGIPNMDPMELTPAEIELPGGLEVKFWNGTVEGMRDCTMDSIMYKNNHAEINLHCDLTVKGLYKAIGRILIFTLNGDGEVNIRTSNISLTGKVKFEDKIKNGTMYHLVKDYTVLHKYDGRVIFNITNLLKGNPLLSKTILNFLNENWKTVADEFGKPIVDNVVKDVFSNIKKIFSGIPKEEMFDP